MTTTEQAPPEPVEYGYIDHVPEELAFTGDFGPDDPWSVHTREVIAHLGGQGLFAGRPVRELGSGDGRNGFIALGNGASEYTAVELEEWRGDLAKKNAATLGLGELVQHHSGEAVAWVNNADPATFDNAVVVACLPQVPRSEETTHTSDAIVEQPSFGDVGDIRLGELTVAQSGLTLVAASLRALRNKITPASDADLLFVLSDRLPEQTKQELFRQTGWQERRVYRTPEPVPQDPDTSAAIFAVADDGRRFFEQSGTPISAQEAEQRRHAALGIIAAGGARPDGYPHHHVSIHHLITA